MDIKKLLDVNHNSEININIFHTFTLTENELEIIF